MVGTGDFNIERFGYTKSHQIMREPQEPPLLEEMILAGESLTMEFKKSATSMKKILSTATAFANTLGGTMVFGVDDIGSVVGLDCNVTEMMRGIAGNLRDCCVPIPPYRLYARTLGDRIIVVLEVDPSEACPCRVASEGSFGSVYIRMGSSTVEAKPRRMHDLVSEGYGHPAEGWYVTRCMFPFGSQAVDDLCGHLSNRSGVNITAEDLIGQGLLREDPQGLIPSRAFLIMFGRDAGLPGVRCSDFRCDGRTASLERRGFAGSFESMVEGSVSFVMEHTSDEGTGVPEIP